MSVLVTPDLIVVMKDSGADGINEAITQTTSTFQ